MQTIQFITDEEAATLIDRIIERSATAADDDAAVALSTIIERLATMPSSCDRDISRIALSRALYPRTFAFDEQREAFAARAAA